MILHEHRTPIPCRCPVFLMLPALRWSSSSSVYCSDSEICAGKNDVGFNLGRIATVLDLISTIAYSLLYCNVSRNFYPIDRINSFYIKPELPTVVSFSSSLIWSFDKEILLLDFFLLLQMKEHSYILTVISVL